MQEVCEDTRTVGTKVLCALIDLLHQGAPAEDFAALLSQLEACPDESADKAGIAERVRMAMALRNRLDLWQQRDTGMVAVIESARDLSGRLDLHELLHAIVSRSRRLLGSQVAWLSAYDKDLKTFHVLAADGALAQSTGHMTAGSKAGIVSIVFATRLPFTTPDYLHDQRFQHDEKLDATFRDEGIAAVAGVPLLWDDEVIGLLFVADRYHRTHTAQNISILSTLATHAAVAMKNALAFEQASAALASAQAARAETERHARSIQNAADAHEQMTSLLAGGASLADLCQAIARLMDGCVMVLDEAGQVLGEGTAPGYASDAAAAYAPHGESSSTLAESAWRSRQRGRSVVAFQSGEETCRVNAVIGGKDVLGSVLLFVRGELDPIAIRNFERSAVIIGIVLLSRERVEAAQARDLSGLLRALVSPGRDDLPYLCEQALPLGVDLAHPASLVLAEMDGMPAAHAVRRLRASQRLPRAIFGEIDGVLVLLCGADRMGDARRAIDQLGTERSGSGYRGIVSRPLCAATDLPGAYLALRRALPVLGRMGVRRHLVDQAEMALYATLFETHDQASLAAFLESTIGPITTHDSKRGSELAATLLSYFDSNQNAKAAAQRLGIHVNTVRQRLTTIEDLIGDWKDAVRALEVHVALRLWSLSGGG